MSVGATLRSYLNDTARAFDRAPVEGVLAVFTAACLSYGIESAQIMQEVVHVVVAALLIALCAWSATLLHAMRAITDRRRWVLTAVAAAAGILYLLFTHDFTHEAEGWRALMLVAAALMIAIATPGWAHSGQDPVLRLRRINARIFLRVVGAGLYGLALFAGLAVALAAVNNLFELKLDNELYGHVFIWIMAVLVPLVIVGGLDDYVMPLEKQSEVGRVVYRMAGFLLPPLVAIYFLILCMYVIRIAITRELPQNLVSPMVIAAGLLGCLSLAVFDPAPQSPLGTRWLRYTPPLFILLAPVGAWALLARVEDYGWTEFRLLRLLVLAMLAALAVAATLRVLRKQSLDLRIIPVALAVGLLLSAVGPWNVLAVSRRDQQARLADVLRQLEIDTSVRAAPRDTTPRVVPGDQYERLTGTSHYLFSHFGARAITDVVPAFPLNADYADLPARFNVAAGLDSTRAAAHMFAHLDAGTRVATPEGAVYRVLLNQPPTLPSQWADGDTIRIVVEADTLSADLSPLLSHLTPQEGRRGRLPAAYARTVVVDRAGVDRGYLVVTEVSASSESGRRRIDHVDGVLTLRSPRQ